MPHVDIDTMNGETTPLTNGEKAHSKVLSHLQTYPVVNDTISFYQSNPYGAKSVSLFQQTYAKFIAPLHPYLATPYSYLSPYLSRADELGDTGLSKVDERFPVVKEDTNKLKESVQGLVGLPLQVVGKGKEYVWSTWEDEYSKTRGEKGAVKSVKALISTELKIGQDGYGLIMSYLSKGKETAHKKVDEAKQ
ncbi:CAP20-like protein [Amniculicola lignicola CBS 123094]|uniref:CAP20-like protein n=1 Tax=Amniculicola lignicola CBS 123094 TaxID=1392246 RepID=A0A6A5WG66_9PLEO|nr:CAP20-like protein [Amniculicola lignicola CBS 123094]